MCESRHQRPGGQGIGSECIQHLRLWINPNARLRRRDGVAVIYLRKKGGFGKELTLAGRVEHHEMVIDGAADEAKPTAFDLVNRRRPIALLEQKLARCE